MGEHNFILDPFEPACVRSYREGRLAERVEAALRELESCRACPRDCGINRLAEQTRVCRVGRYAWVVSAFPHHGEEACLRGWRGSGTVFLGGCNLHCVFCQNWETSQQRSGAECRPQELAALMLGLQEQGCHNVNLVTPEHVVPQVVEALALAAPKLRVPIVYNSSGYDALSSLRLLDGLVDIYMPDFKFWKPETAARLSKARDYPQRAREAILEMHRQTGPLRFGPDGLARRGVLVRHLVMPQQTEEAAAIFEWLAREVSPDTYLNIMGQYRPAYRVGIPADDGSPRYPEILRPPSREEIGAAYAAARHAGLSRLDQRRAPSVLAF